jgi:SAM-dependent methyltransferase
MGAQYTGIDFSAKMIEAARNLMRDQIATGVARLNVGDATKLDLPDAAFDSIIAMGLVEYFSRSKVDRVFEEMVRVLAPGGVLIVTIPKRWHWGKVIELLLTPLRKWIRWRPYSSDLKLRRKEAEAFERLYMTPMDVDRTAQKVGLHKLAQRHYNVQLVCPPFTLLGPRLAYLINRPFEWLALIPGGWFFASGYIGMYTR